MSLDAMEGTSEPGNCNVPSRLSVKEAHEKLVENLHIQLLLEGQLVLEESSPDDAAAQEAQGACLYGLVDSSRCPLCIISRL